jgi:hypothetical protein
MATEETDNLIENMEGADLSYIDSDISELPPSDIIAYNELRSCADLYRMFQEGVLDIRPDFQRDEVWSDSQKTRFIDSLIKKLPIPSMCFSLDYKTEKWQVIDGLQRMLSIIRFLKDDSTWRLSVMQDIDPKLSGKTVVEIKTTDNGVLFKRLANLTIPITVLRCDYSKKSHTNYLFTIFHRLNTGGVKLTNQEIRNAIYNGTFNTCLKAFNRTPEWRTILGLKEGRSYRFSKEELILRFFAFSDRLDKYEGSLSKFLNEYMSDNINPTSSWVAGKADLFNRTVNIIYKKIAAKKTITKTGNAFMEALLYGVGKNLAKLEKAPIKTVKSYYSKLQKDENFSDENLYEGLGTKAKVNKRLTAAEKIFAAK